MIMTAHGSAPGPVRAPGALMPRALFIARYAERPMSGIRAVETPRGVDLNGRPYIALRCHCIDPTCDGWIMVHDEPAAIAHFERLFGADAPR